MRRRAIIVAATLLAALSAAPFAAAADRPARLGVLGPAEQPRFADLVSGLRAGLLAQGHAAETIAVIEAPVLRGDRVAAEAATQRLLGQGVAVVFAIGSEMARLARRAAPGLPIVFITPGDPVAAGLVASFARPGGNMTAVTFEFPELSGKRLELVRDAIGGGKRVVVVFDPRDASPRQGLAAAQRVAPALGMTLAEQAFAAAGDLDAVTSALAGADALLMIPGGLPAAHHGAMIRAAHLRRVATMFPARTEAAAEALVTYGAKDSDIARDAARLIDRILRGTDAGDIAVERPTRIELVINLKTAKALGIEIPATLLARADEVIE